MIWRATSLGGTAREGKEPERWNTIHDVVHVADVMRSR